LGRNSPRCLALLFVRRAEQPEQQKKGHHRRHEVGIGNLPGAAVMTAMALGDDLLDDDDLGRLVGAVRRARSHINRSREGATAPSGAPRECAPSPSLAGMEGPPRRSGQTPSRLRGFA
jgi:hypothetical protein